MIKLTTAAALVEYVQQNETEPVHLHLTDIVTDEELVTIRPLMTHVMHLECEGATFRFDGAQAFFGSETLCNLEVLSWHRCVISLGVLNNFANNEHLKRLHTLHLEHNMGVDEDLWGSWPYRTWWQQLRHLTIIEPDFEDYYLDYLTYDGHCDNLTHVHIESEVLTDASTRHWKRVNWSDEMASFVIKSPLFTHEAYKILAQLALPEQSKAHFRALASKGPATYESIFGEVRSVLAKDLNEDVHQDVLVHHLNKLNQMDASRYQAQVLPYLQNPTIVWPEYISIDFEYDQDVVRVAAVLPHVKLEIQLWGEQSERVWMQLARLQYLAQVTHIYGWVEWDDEALDTFLSSPYLNPLTSFYNQEDMTEDQALRILHAPQMAHLKQLALSVPETTGEHLKVLAGHTMVATLEELSLERTPLTVDNMQVLTNTAFESLRIIHLENTELTPELVTILCAAPWFSMLAEVDVDIDSSVDHECYRQLARAVLKTESTQLRVFPRTIEEALEGTGLLVELEANNKIAPR